METVGFIKGAESIPVLLSIPLTGYLNEASLSYGKAGYYLCSAATSISAILMFFIGFSDANFQNTSKYSNNNGYFSIILNLRTLIKCIFPPTVQSCPIATPEMVDHQ